jgi:hypothetical protein
MEALFPGIGTSFSGRGRITAPRSASPFAEQTLRNGCSGGRFTRFGVTMRTLVTGPEKQLHYQSSVVLQIRGKKRETRT